MPAEIDFLIIIKSTALPSHPRTRLMDPSEPGRGDAGASTDGRTPRGSGAPRRMAPMLPTVLGGARAGRPRQARVPRRGPPGETDR